MKQPYQVVWWDDLSEDSESTHPTWHVGTRTIKLGDNLEVQQYSYGAAVMAISAEDAQSQITESYFSDVKLEWVSVTAQPFGWSPSGNQRFQQPGMIWDQRPH